jgi:hypothetical protein
MNYFRIPPDTTYFHVTHGKAGSQWIRGILEDLFGPAVIPAEYDARQVFGAPVYSEKIYTCVYLGKPEFDTLKIPGRVRQLVIIRDLRDTLISMYFSARYSHALEIPAIETERHILTNLSEEDGISYLMETALPLIAHVQRSWLRSKERCYRLEDIAGPDSAPLRKMLEAAYAIRLEGEMIEQIAANRSFEKLAGRERGHEDIYSHYRIGVHGDWRNHFTSAIKKRFCFLYNDLLIEGGYEKDSNWQTGDLRKSNRERIKLALPAAMGRMYSFCGGFSWREPPL